MLHFVFAHVQFVMGVFQLGFITIFLSEPLISGYTTGAAVHVFTSQLQHITGLDDRLRVTPGVFRIPRVRKGERRENGERREDGEDRTYLGVWVSEVLVRVYYRGKQHTWRQRISKEFSWKGKIGELVTFTNALSCQSSGVFYILLINTISVSLPIQMCMIVQYWPEWITQLTQSHWMLLSKWKIIKVRYLYNNKSH